MKTPRTLVTLAIASAALSQTAYSAVLVGWDSWDDNVANTLSANKTTTGFTGTIGYLNSQLNPLIASTDGTFGTVAGASGADPGLLVRVNDGSSFTLNLTNNTGSSWTLQTLNFDFAARGNAGSYGFNAFTVTYNSGGLGPASTQVASASGLAYTISELTGAVADHPDFDYNLADNLTDLVLADGESAAFTFQFSGNYGDPGKADGSAVSSVIDNIAITGTAVPEPSAILLSALGSLAFLRRKR